MLRIALLCLLLKSGSGGRLPLDECSVCAKPFGWPEIKLFGCESRNQPINDDLICGDCFERARQSAKQSAEQTSVFSGRAAASDHVIFHSYLSDSNVFALVISSSPRPECSPDFRPPKCSEML